ncbi:MAG: DNA mismatch repair protein MutT [Gemmobacter sp.]|jgi:8-oxo-dGTP pyrophosphatase MutT (NUDIX family)
MVAPDARLWRGGNRVNAPTPIRDAATVILWRAARSGPEVLMGQRGAGAAFMPSKFVFPGGAVDAADAAVALADPLGPDCARRLTAPGAPAPATLAATAIRETWEETGLALGRAGRGAAGFGPGWEGLAPSAAGLRFVFRAITPPGRPRRFDARFFLADVAEIAGDPEDFSRATDELTHLRWVPIAAARELDLPFITEVVLAEVARLGPGETPPGGVPFFDNSGPVAAFRRIV